MIEIKSQEINIAVSRIINWPESDRQVSFQISFYSQTNGSLIISKQANGKYERGNKIMNLGCLMKIKYLHDENTVVMRLAYRMGFGGKIVLGDFTINLQSLGKKKQLRFTLSQTRSQYLIVEEYQPFSRQEQKEAQKIIESSDYEVQKYKNKNNEDFIRQREEFLERHSNRSRDSSNLSSSRNFFSSRVNNLLAEVKSYRQSKNSGSQNLIVNHLSSDLINNYSLAKSTKNSRYSNYSEKKDIQKKHCKNLNANCQNRSQMNNDSSSQKYILFVNNLNIVPCEQYYQTKIQQITNIKKPSNFTSQDIKKMNRISKQYTGQIENRRKVNRGKWNHQRNFSEYY